MLFGAHASVVRTRFFVRALQARVPLKQLAEGLAFLHSCDAHVTSPGSCRVPSAFAAGAICRSRRVPLCARAVLMQVLQAQMLSKQQADGLAFLHSDDVHSNFR